MPLVSVRLAGALMTGKSAGASAPHDFLTGAPYAPSQQLIQPVIEGQLPAKSDHAERLRDAGYRDWTFGNGISERGFGRRKNRASTHLPGHANTKPSATEGR